MRVHLGSDHAGLDLKQHLLAWLAEHDYEPVDHGPFAFDADDDYPVYCLRVGDAVASEQARGRDSLGVVIGGSGNGEQMAANKVRGVRAGLAWSTDTARLAREHNDANVISVGARLHPHEDAVRFVDTFLTTAYSEDPRHTRRIAMMSAYEQSGELPPMRTSAEERPAGDA